jgi:hypothetical protein
MRPSTIAVNTETPTVPGVASARVLLGLQLGDDAIKQFLREEVGLNQQEAANAITTARLIDKAEAAH